MAGAGSESEFCSIHFSRLLVGGGGDAHIDIPDLLQQENLRQKGEQPFSNALSVQPCIQIDGLCTVP